MVNSLEIKNIIVFRELLLNPSETFIKSQTLSLSEFVPHFVGSKRVNGLNLVAERLVLINYRNTLLEIIKEKLFKLTLNPPTSLIKALRKFSPLLIHAHFAFDAIYALPIAESLNIPLLVTLHGYDVTISDDVWAKSPHFTGRSFPKRRQKLIESGQVKFVAVSEHIKQKALEKGYPAERVIVHYIGVDTESFIPVDKIPGKHIVTFVGRLVEKKGCEYLIRAMNLVQKNIPNSELVIVGDGPLREELESLAVTLPVNCSFMGMQSNKVVQDLMKKSRIVCAPSITSSSGDTEGLPIVIYEAMALGIPVVSTYSAGIPEAVFHGKTGLLSPEKDVESLATNIIQLLNNDDVWLRHSSNSRIICEEMFSLTLQTKKLEKIYLEMIAEFNR